MQKSPILVIGSTGKIGRRIVQRLEGRGYAVRGGSRHSEPPFDWENPSTWPAALRGAEAVYISYYPDLAAPGAPAAIEELTARAADAGVRRLVLLSGRGERNAEHCEDIVRGCGLDFTLIRASWFSQNFNEGHLLEPVLGGVVAMPAGSVREPFVDADDIADVAVAALTEDHHAGQLYEVTGPRLLTFEEAVSEISAAAGRRVEYAPISLEQFRAGMTEAAGPELANLLTDLCSEVFDGRNESLADGVQKALGREPRDFADFCRASAASGVWSLAA
ncbi:NAD(P)H-binding protein [Hoeflea sp. TYP-13]|uniref:NAD(P)H-binding protein n=1 Tax=Hoeflea sp. TYP-13 TaxID=3230023 RepID=UPI0034C5DC70